MSNINLIAAGICTFATLLDSTGSLLDALNGALAILNLALYLKYA